MLSHYHGIDEYMLPFLMNLNLRKSCFECKFKGTERLADITLADFWGIDKSDLDMDDDKGISLIIIHSEKADSLIRSLGCILKEKEQSDAININNMAVLKSATYTTRSDLYMEDALSKGVIKAYKYWFEPNFLYRIIRKCRETVRNNKHM